MRSVVLVVLLPFAAFAQTPTPETAVAPVATRATSAAPGWSIGAGVGFGSFFSTSPTYVSSSINGLYISPQPVPAAVASVERRLSGRTWLVIGADGSFSHDRQDVPADSTGFRKTDMYGLGVSAGIRRFLTRAGAPVDVSVDVTASAGANRWKGGAAYRDYTNGGAIADASFDASGWRTGATFGLAVDRELTGALSVRVATPIVGAWYGKTRTEVTGQPTLDREELGAGLRIAPRLELRLAF
jgi:hypothetical protein